MSERERERAERVRRALTEWDSDLGELRLPEERVATMRALVLEASAEHARGSVRSRDDSAPAAGWPASARPRRRRLALALALAAGVLLVAIVGVRRSGSLGERAEREADVAPVIAQAESRRPEQPGISAGPEPEARRAVDERSGAEEGLALERKPTESIPARPLDGGRPADRAAGLIEDGAEVLSVGAAAAADGLASAAARRAARRRDRAEDAGSHGRGAAPVAVAALGAGAAGEAPGETGSGAGSRRIRRLDFETPSGRKIHWILDSEFRGVGGR
ncbi:MAG TPA: hypothetical protein VMT85_10130 [Thermoanaerobaculia bacterium]|nr:hypothetical protein [Thermoanaerobaculia bacterium]